MVENGKEAIEAMQSDSFDIVFMDYHMPVMDGIEATRYIHHHWTKEEIPVIIAMSADAFEKDREKFLDAGM